MHSSKKYFIKAGKLFNSETGLYENRMAIFITGDYITDVKAFDKIQPTDTINTTIIDLSGYTVMPGLIDAHTHLLYKEAIIPGNPSAGVELMKTVTMDGDAYRAIYGSVKAKSYLQAGITSVQDLGNSGSYDDMALRRAINESLIEGPNMRCAGRGLSSEGGQIPDVIYKHRNIIEDEYRIVKGPDDAVQAVRENITQGADVIKIYSNNTPNVTALSVEEIQAIVKEAHRYGIRVTAHATDNQAVYNAVIGGVDGIEHGYEMQDSTLALMVKKGVCFIPTDGDSVSFMQYGKLSYPNDSNVAENVKRFRKFLGSRLMRAVKAGVIIVAGSDDYVDYHLPFAEPSLRTLIGYYESGMTIPEILRAATINAAMQLNWKGKTGVIKQGYRADIIAFNNNISRDIHEILHVKFVMKNGKVYKNEIK